MCIKKPGLCSSFCCMGWAIFQLHLNETLTGLRIGKVAKSIMIYHRPSCLHLNCHVQNEVLAVDGAISEKSRELTSFLEIFCPTFPCFRRGLMKPTGHSDDLLIAQERLG